MEEETLKDSLALPSWELASKQAIISRLKSGIFCEKWMLIFRLNDAKKWKKKVPAEGERQGSYFVFNAEEVKGKQL